MKKEKRLYTIHEMLQHKKMNPNIENDLLTDLAYLKDVKYALRYLLFGNLCSELKEKCNIDDLITLCKNVLGNDCSYSDLLYKIINNNELFDSLQTYGINEKKYCELNDNIILTQADIDSLRIKIDYYDYLVDLQRELDNLSQMQLSFYLNHANDLLEKIRNVEQDIESLLFDNELYSKSSLISKILDYKKYRINKRKLQKSLAQLKDYKSQYDINQESTAQCVESLRYELINKINAIAPEVHFPKDHYIKIIFDCSCKDKIVGNSDLFISRELDLDALVNEYDFKKKYLHDLKTQMSKVKAKQKEIFKSFGEQVDDEMLIRFNNILSMEVNKPSTNSIRPYISVLILQLIQETDTISKDTLVELLDSEDIKYLNQTYETEILYYLKNEITNMYELSLDTLISKHNESNKLNLVKMKI